MPCFGSPLRGRGGGCQEGDGGLLSCRTDVPSQLHLEMAGGGQGRRGGGAAWGLRATSEKKTRERRLGLKTLHLHAVPFITTRGPGLVGPDQTGCLPAAPQQELEPPDTKSGQHNNNTMGDTFSIGSAMMSLPALPVAFSQEEAPSQSSKDQCVNNKASVSLGLRPIKATASFLFFWRMKRRNAAHQG